MASPTPTDQPPLVAFAQSPSTALYNQWLTYFLAGIPCAGTIPRGGIKGFKRETGWDIKKGKGSAGATLTLQTLPPVEGTITNQLFTDQDFDDWDNFASTVLSTSVADQQASGLSIAYPQFASVGLTTVVVKNFTGPEYQGKGMYHVSVELIEWQSPPPTSIVKTVSSTLPDFAGTIYRFNGPQPLDAQSQAYEQQLAALNAQLKKP